MEKWPQLFITSFGGFQNADDWKLWQAELKNIVSGWADEDSLKINTYLCRVIRGISVRGETPRADGKAGSFAKYTVRDLALWVELERQDTGYYAKTVKKTVPKVGYARTVCNAIQERIDAGERVKAALLVDNPCGETEVCNALGVNRGPSDGETIAIRDFCRGIKFAYWKVLEDGNSRGSIDTTGIGSNGRGSFEEQTEI